jgi:flagellar biosynthesis/type III secretory pathway M-ring protein FliF/YscJ
MNIDNVNANEIVYEENTELSSEEELMKSVNLENLKNLAEEEEDVEQDNTVETKPQGLSSYFNMNTILLVIGLLVLLYFVFKKDVDKFISGMTKPATDTNPSSGLCA